MVGGMMSGLEVTLVEASGRGVEEILIKNH